MHAPHQNVHPAVFSDIRGMMAGLLRFPGSVPGGLCRIAAGILTIAISISAPRAAAAQTSIACDLPRSGTIGGSSQRNTYVFTANAGEKVIVAAVATSGTLHAHVEVRLNNTLIGANFYNDATGILPLPLTATYTIIVSDYSLTGIGDYNVYLQFTTPGRCGPEISCGQTASANIAAIAEMDSYHFSANAGEKVIVAAVATSGTLHPHLDVYDPTGSRIGGNFYNDATDVLSLPLTGVYTILVRDYSLAALGGYNLTLQFTTPGRCGRTITCGDTLDGTIGSVAELDKFRSSERQASKWFWPL